MKIKINKKDSKEEKKRKELMRKNLCRTLNQKGDYIQSKKNLKTGEGGLVKARNERKKEKKKKKTKQNQLNIVTCANCYAVITKKYFYSHHSKFCFKKADEPVTTKSFTDDNNFYNEVLVPMRNNVGASIMSNKLLYKFGLHLWDLAGYEKPGVVRAKLRDGNEIEIMLAENLNINLTAAITSKKYVLNIIDVIKKHCDFRKKEGRFATFENASKALRFCRLIEEISKFTERMVAREEDEKKLKDVQFFIEDFNDEAEKKIKNFATLTLQRNRYNNKKKKILPNTEEIIKVDKNIEEDISKIYKDLKKNPTDYDLFRKLLEKTLASLTIFNRARGGAVQYLTIKEFEEARNNNIKPSNDLIKTFNDTDKLLIKNFLAVEVEGKCRKPCQILIPKKEEKIINFLINNRCFSEVNPNNIYIFPAGKNSLNPIRGTDSIRINRNDNSKITATNLRKQIATNSQLLNMTNNENDVMAAKLGHNLTTFKTWYRQNEISLIKTQAGKVLMLAKKGKISDHAHEKLKDISLQEEGKQK